jgi:hypothetical protein
MLAPFPSMEFESEIPLIGNPDSGKKQRALVGSNLPFFGNVTGNIMALVKSLGDAGLVGLIALGVILWLFSSRKMA